MRFTVVAVALLAALSILAYPGTSSAASITINNVSVTVGATNGCISGCTNPTNNIWSTAAGTTLFSSDVSGLHSLVLTQTSTSTFNFDTSDNNGLNCSPTSPCTTTLSINGLVIPLSGPQANVLANNNQDTGSLTHNEASNWNQAVFNGGPGGLIVWFGYADTAHSDPCADTVGTIASNCLPDNPWQGSPNTLFVGNPTTTAPGAGCDRPGVTSCFDAGAIRIEVNPGATVPEPSSVVLIGFGLAGLLALNRKRRYV